METNAAWNSCYIYFFLRIVYKIVSIYMLVLSGSQARIISKTGFVKVPKGFDVVDFLYVSCVSSCWCCSYTRVFSLL